MALISKGGIKIIEGKAYVHPLTIPELEFLLTIVAEKGFEPLTFRL